MTDTPDPDLGDAHRRFDEACERLRPDLHRFCTRMTGNPCDGEDALHDALVAGHDRLAELRDAGALRAWLFRIAHNKCLDLLRRKRHVDVLDEELEEEVGDGALGIPAGAVDEALDLKARAERLLIHIASALPPRERACIVLKDVLDCSLEETAEITGASVGAVKAALHRGRQKLVEVEDAPAQLRLLDPAHRALAERYVHAFNARDWDGVRALLSSDARLEVVHRSEGPFARAPYFTNYERIPWTWRLGLALVDGVEEVVHFREIDGVWSPHAVLRIGVAGQAISLVRDYVHVDGLLRHATVTEAIPS